MKLLRWIWRWLCARYSAALKRWPWLASLDSRLRAAGRWLRGRYYVVRNWALALYDQDFPRILGRKGGTWGKRLLYRLILSAEVLVLALALQVGMAALGLIGGIGSGARFAYTRFDDIWSD